MEKLPKKITKREDKLSMSNPQSMERIQLVLTDLLEGVTNSEIIKKYSEIWNIKEATVYIYIHAACKEMARFREKNRDELIDETYQKYAHLYKRAIRKGNDKLARDIINDMVRLLGLAAPSQLQVESVSKVVNINFVPPVD